MASLKRRGAQLFLPDDVVTATECSESTMAHIKPIGEVAADDMILDFGPLAMRRLVGMLGGAGTIVRGLRTLARVNAYPTISRLG